MTIDEIVDGIIAGKWSEELLEAIRKAEKHNLYFELYDEFRNKRKVSQLLEEAFNKAGVKYSKCEETGLVITHFLVEEIVYETATMDSDGDVEENGTDYGDTTFRCPHCGREFYNVDIAVDIIRGDRDEYGNPK